MPIDDTGKPNSLARRIGWFLLIWLASVMTLAVIALLIRSAIHP